jgi:hypothetical protein
MNKAKFLKELLNEKINFSNHTEDKTEYENILFEETYQTLIDQVSITKGIVKRTEKIKSSNINIIEKLSEQNEKIVSIDKELENLDDNINLSKNNVRKILKNIIFDKIILIMIIILLIFFLGFVIFLSFAPFFGKILYSLINKK